MLSRTQGLLPRLIRLLAYIGRDSVIYPSELRIRLMALGSIGGALGLFSYNYLQGNAASNLVMDAVAMVLAVALLYQQDFARKKSSTLGLYSLTLWFCLMMVNAWAYVATDYSRFSLIMVLITVCTYYLMAEWWHVLISIVTGTAVCYALSWMLGRSISYPSASHWMLLGMTHLCWLGYSLSNRNKRGQRLREAQALVRHIQRGLQPGLQSMEGLLPELYHLLPEVENRRSVARITRIAERLKSNTTVMEEYLDHQSINARFLSLNERIDRIDAQDLVREVVNSFPYTREEFRAAVSVEVAQNFCFDGSLEQWRHVLRNLLENALTALYRNPREPRPRDIVFSLVCTESVGRLRVRDRGAGIALQHLPYVFEPFFSTESYAGLGLGLSYCKTVVENCGGSIAARSRPYEGCCITILLPCMLATYAPPHLPHAHHAPAGVPRRATPRA